MANSGDILLDYCYVFTYLIKCFSLFFSLAFFSCRRFSKTTQNHDHNFASSKLMSALFISIILVDIAERPLLN